VRSSVSLRTIRRGELAEHHTTLTVANDLAVRRALEIAGVEFTNGDQPGVRLTKVTTPRSAQAASVATPGLKTRGKSAKPADAKR
jgi:hypothetical protein